MLPSVACSALSCVPRCLLLSLLSLPASACCGPLLAWSCSLPPPCWCGLCFPLQLGWLCFFVWCGSLVCSRSVGCGSLVCFGKVGAWCRASPPPPWASDSSTESEAARRYGDGCKMSLQSHGLPIAIRCEICAEEEEVRACVGCDSSLPDDSASWRSS